MNKKVFSDIDMGLSAALLKLERLTLFPFVFSLVISI